MATYGVCLPRKQEFADGRRRCLEIADRADLALPHDAERSQHGRRDDQQDHDAAGGDRHGASEFLIVSEPRLDLDRVR